MNFITKILMLPVSRRKVETNTLENYKGILEADLELRKVTRSKDFSEALLTRLVQEAYRRAAEQDSEGIARYGAMYRQIEEVAKDVAIACNNEMAANETIRGILSHHRALD
jgi:hypothetical protein